MDVFNNIGRNAKRGPGTALAACLVAACVAFIPVGHVLAQMLGPEISADAETNGQGVKQALDIREHPITVPAGTRLHIISGQWNARPNSNQPSTPVFEIGKASTPIVLVLLSGSLDRVRIDIEEGAQLVAVLTMPQRGKTSVQVISKHEFPVRELDMAFVRDVDSYEYVRTLREIYKHLGNLPVRNFAHLVTPVSQTKMLVVIDNTGDPTFSLDWPAVSQSAPEEVRFQFQGVDWSLAGPTAEIAAVEGMDEYPSRSLTAADGTRYEWMRNGVLKETRPSGGEELLHPLPGNFPTGALSGSMFIDSKRNLLVAPVLSKESFLLFFDLNERKWLKARSMLGLRVSGLGYAEHNDRYYGALFEQRKPANDQTRNILEIDPESGYMERYEAYFPGLRRAGPGNATRLDVISKPEGFVILDSMNQRHSGELLRQQLIPVVNSEEPAKHTVQDQLARDVLAVWWLDRDKQDADLTFRSALYGH